MAEWSNWAGNVRAYAVDVHEPADVDQVAALVTATRSARRRLRPVGSGHSFTAIASPADQQLVLNRLSGIISHDPATHRVRVRAGTVLRELSPALWELGLALPNLGDYDGQTLAGALNTGTHGTGLHHPGMSAAVVGVELVTGTGEVVRIDSEHRPHLVPAVALGLGTLGVVTEYELQCVPAFLLRAHEAPGRLGSVLERLPQLIAEHDHFEFYWFPHTDRVLTKTNDRVTNLDELAPLPPWRRKLDDDLLSNTVLDGLNRVGAKVPRSIGALNAVAARALSERTFTDRSYQVFATDRRMRFTESEFSVPIDAVGDVLARLRRWFARSGERVAIPIEVRFTAPDDRWLSTSHSRHSAYIAVHQYHRRSYDPYFTAFWDIVRSHEARPHWGKLHSFSRDELAARYPKMDEFKALRDEFDPDRTFGNAYLERVLGR